MALFSQVYYILVLALAQTYYNEQDGYSLVEELRQEFFQNYPGLEKNPQSNSPFSSDKRYLNDICAKYNSRKGDKALEEAKSKIQGTTDAMKNNMVLMMGNQDRAKVLCNI